jgi:S-layer homology domain
MSNFSTKIASTVSVVALVATAMSASLVSAASEFLPYATLLADNAVIGTQTNESGYRLGDTVTRAELAKVTANLGGYTIASCAGTTYGDVGASLGDLCGAIEALAEAGVVSTANANFRPSAAVTRAEATKMLLGAVGEAGSSTAAGYMDTASLGDLAMYINRANEMGCAAKATYFRPTATASRGEAFKLAACVAGLTPTTPPTGTGVVVPPTGTGVVAGALTVALDGAATAQYVPKNASSVKVGAVKLTAGTTDVTVSSMVVSRSGLGNATDILSSNGIRAAQNGSVVSSSADYYNSSSQKGNIYFSPALVVKAGTSVSVDVLVNLSGAENSQHQFTLDSVKSTATVTGAPVTLGLLNTTSYVTTNTTAIASASAGSVTPGKSAVSVVKVEVTSGNRDTTVKGFTLTRSGSTDFTKRLANVKVYRGGVAVGTVTMSNEKLIVSGLNDVLASGNTQTYEIKADILVDGSSTAALGFKFDSSTDVSATEVATGYSTQVTASSTANVTFNSVEVTFSKTSTGNVTLAPGTNNVKFFAGKLTSVVPLTVRGMTIATPVTGSGIDAFVNNQLSVKVNGSEIATLTNISGSQTILPSFVVDAATPAIITIEGSIKSNNTVNGAFTFSVALTDVRDSSNNSASIGAGASLTGDKTTIGTAVVQIKTATVAAPSTSRLYASADQEIGRLAVYTQNEPVRVQKLVLVNTGSASLSGVVSSTSSIKLYDVATGLEVSSSPTIVGNTVTFDSMNDTVAKDTTKNYRVVASIGSIDAYLNSTLILTYSTGTVVRDTNSTALVPSANVTFKTYNLGTVPPTVTVAKTATLDKYLVTVTNIDTNTGITLTGVTVKFQSRFAGSTTTSFSGTLCLRDQGSSEDCTTAPGAGTSSGYTATQAGLTQVFTLGGLTSAGQELAKNGGNTTFEVYLSNAPLFVAGDFTQISVDKLYFGGTSESYVGVTNATAQAAK